MKMEFHAYEIQNGCRYNLKFISMKFDLPHKAIPEK